MRKVTFSNAAGTEIEIDYRPYLLRSFEIDPVVVTTITSKGYLQDGETPREYYANKINVVLEVGIFNDDIDEAIFDFQTIFNPMLGVGSLLVETDYQSKVIPVKVDAVPKVRYDEDNYADDYAALTVSLTAYGPYFVDEEYTSVDLVGLTGGFYWDDPEYFDDETGFYMGEITGSSKVLVNTGSVSAPLRIEWTGTAVNPKITLADIGEEIALNYTLAAGKRIILTTGYNDKNCYEEDLATGVITKKNSIVDDDSVYFSLPLGSSTVSFSADSGTSTVTIRYKQMYVAV